ncbi:hypothetical protein Vadar_015761 [Vaccinium darrowii]|uniref:Uncharacterized protein n=1 Tax=Vaccinium darrowii TaxID=229202 RepID=A0ACB7XZA4_9ERIC|nr:hypothetical protein Vadar_015761 [Vaccinium darrowii]
MADVVVRLECALATEKQGMVRSTEEEDDFSVGGDVDEKSGENTKWDDSLAQGGPPSSSTLTLHSENTRGQHKSTGKVSKLFQKSIEFLAKGIKWKKRKVDNSYGAQSLSAHSSSHLRLQASRGNEAYLKGQIFPTPNLRIFRFSELKTATKNFRGDRLMGEGGFGKVYKGWLNEKNGSGLAIAVKKLSPKSMQGFDEWQTAHGLAYAGGSAVQPLPWGIQFNILTGAARGLDFLHGLEKQVIYRDFKTSNLLLDESFNAKIADFGLARLGPSGSETHVSTWIVGTYGYIAPEHFATGLLNMKSDVHGYGVVLVEMLTGLHAFDKNHPSGKHSLVDWVKPFLSQKRKLVNIMDSRLEGKYPSKAAFQIAQVALKCLGLDPKARPTMKEVVETLERLDASNEKPRDPLHNRPPLPPTQERILSHQLPQ